MKTGVSFDRSQLTICLVCGLAMILIVILSLLSNGVKREPPTLETVPKEELLIYQKSKHFVDDPETSQKLLGISDDHVESHFLPILRERQKDCERLETLYPQLKVNH